jgi:exportin-1
MTQEFGSIYELSDFVLNMYITNQHSLKTSLVKMTLKTLCSFLNWIPFGYIFETDFCQKLVQNFLVVPSFRIETIKCLTEIGID